MTERPPDDDMPDDAVVERLRTAFRAGDGPEQPGEPVDADRVWRAVTGESSPEDAARSSPWWRQTPPGPPPGAWP
ncbi:hypothetical protein ACLESD_48990, partial [Pyxidicoccus sp. 3LFB2]